MHEPPVLFVAGPTASGKTELAIRLADRIDAMLINVDAAQVYRGMDIGTAKLDPGLRQRYPHQLIDIRDPAEVYDASQFIDDARRLIAEAHAEGRVPILVGGTMFYFSALEHGVSSLPQADAELRKRLESEAAEQGWAALYRRLQLIDPALCETIRAGDRQRIQRALEIHALSGRPPSQVMAESAPTPFPGRILKFNLYTPDRQLLHRRIAKRFEQMLADGLVDEVAALKAREDLHPELPSMRCVGYRQAWQYLEGTIDYSRMFEAGIAATRQLAKRQLTWLRHQRGQVWLSSEYPHNDQLVRRFLD